MRFQKEFPEDIAKLRNDMIKKPQVNMSALARSAKNIRRLMGKDRGRIAEAGLASSRYIVGGNSIFGALKWEVQYNIL